MRDLGTRPPAVLIWTFSLLSLLTAFLPATAQVPEEEFRLVGTTFNVGADTFEPTIGADPEGNLYFVEANGETPLETTFKPGMFRSTDRGASWTDITHRIANQNIPIETNDPYIHVDPATGRVFSLHMSPILTCGFLSWTDNGGQSWSHNPAGCFPTVVWDHQTFVSAKPRVLTTQGYPNVLHQCVNAVYANMCSRSLDGGLTWSPPVASFGPLGGCTGTGHLAAAPDGTIYLPTTHCGQEPTVYVSRDDGMTWTQRVIAGVREAWTDPSVAVDPEGNVYAAFVDTKGVLYYAVSRDLGATWTERVVASPAGVTAALPAIAVGDPGRIVIAYLGTDDLEDGHATNPLPPPSEEAWYPYLTVSFDALAESPTFHSLSASGSDPLSRGHECPGGSAVRCRYQWDFIDAIVGPDGRPYAAFADGCTGACATDPQVANNEGRTGTGVVATLTESPMWLCEARCAAYGPAD